MKQKVIYPGTFDPVTNGHIDIITRASKLFSEVVVAVADNSSKGPYLSLATRIKLVQDAVVNLPQVTVLGFDTLLIDFAQKHQANIILRGLRAVNDFEYELQLASMNRKLSQEIESLFLTPSEHLMCISSSLVREISLLGGDVSQFVPSSVVDALAYRREQRAEKV